ncbi:taste receptor type 1 member 1 [Ornithorhynchus anatinus]|uniref:Taste 1 receptor member 1 n=1 Tax=Ornithorhynchus anatinus TaxID=9258 RepID=F7CBJ2_ORNAN|nr:taste receptor type 1 member 1 [Ornithorhynchus anatinus]
MLLPAFRLLYLHLFVFGESASGCQETEMLSDFSLPGDHILGGLFSIHSSLESRSKPEVTSCDGVERFNSDGYHLFQAMRFTIEEINNSTSLLPNTTLGYELYDVCTESSNLFATLSLLAEPQGRRIEVQRDLTRSSPKVVAVIGPDNTNYALASAAILSAFMVPQISYEASSVTFSQKRDFPSFLRTIPSDEHQVEALVHLLGEFGWHWFSLVGSDNEYGWQGAQSLRALATQRGMCIAHQGTVPLRAQPGDRDVRALVAKVNRTSVVVVFSSRRLAQVFFETVVQERLREKVWLASEDWSLSRSITRLPGVRGIGTVIGVAVQQGRVPGIGAFEAAYVRAEKGPARPCQESACLAGNQICSRCRSFSRDDRPELEPFAMSVAYNVYAAVYAVAHGLHQLLGCSSGTCARGPVRPQQLLEKIWQVNFSLEGNPVHFDPNGDPARGYDIVVWGWNGPSWTFSIIGSARWHPIRLTVDRALIRWHTRDNQVPRSVCSEDCAEGQERVITGHHHCCFDCEPCRAGTFLNKSNPYVCQPCEKDQWSPAGSSACFNRTVVFLTWREPVSLALLAANSALLLLLAGAAALFARHRHSPVVRSAGGRTCFLMLGSLAGGSCSLYCFFGEPTAPACLLRQSLFAVCFTVCLSCVTVRSLQLIFIFKVACRAPGLYRAWVRYRGPGVFVGLSCAAQLLLCVAWLAAHSPAPAKEYGRSPDLVVFECSEGRSLGSRIGVVFIGLLSVVCFVCGYLGKDLPENYNEAKCITFSLILYFVSWIGFSTTYSVYRGKYLAAANVLAILNSLGGIFGGYFGPKCYVILCRPDLNTSEHFQASIQDYTKRYSSA